MRPGQISTADSIAAQTAAGSLSGVAPGSAAQFPARPNASSSVVQEQRTLLYQKIVVGAGQTYPIVVRGNYVYVEGVVYNTAATYNIGIGFTTPTIRSDTVQSVAQIVEPFREIEFAVPFNTLQISNPNPQIEVTITLWLGFGKIRRDGSRRMRDKGVGATFSNIAYAANRTVGAGPLIYDEVCAPFNQRARIKKATAAIDMNLAAAAVTAGADFTLWLAPWRSAAYADNAVFTLGTMLDVSFTMPTQIRFPSFITGGAGSTVAICEVSDIDIEVASANSQAGYDFMLYGTLVSNSAWSPGAVGALRTYLVLEQG